MLLVLLMEKRRGMEGDRVTYLAADVLVVTSGSLWDAAAGRDRGLLSVFFLSDFSGMESREQSCSFVASSLPLARSATVSARLTIIAPSYATPPPLLTPPLPYARLTALTRLSSSTQLLKLKADKGVFCH